MKKNISFYIPFKFFSSITRYRRRNKIADEVSNKISSFDNMMFDFYVLENRSENIRQETKGSVTISKNLYRNKFFRL